MIRVGERAAISVPAAWRKAKCSTMTAPTGGKPTHCFPAMSRMSGTQRWAAKSSASTWRLAGCSHGPRSSGVEQHFTFSRGDYHWKHECCCYAVRQGGKSQWQGDRTQTTVWEIANNNPFGNRQREQSWGHGTQKPVECMRRPIVNNSRPGQLVYDPFLGSGTSLIAAEMTGRVCCGLELSPAYVDVILRRWQAFTGVPRSIDVSGQSFDERAGGHGGDRWGSPMAENRLSSLRRYVKRFAIWLASASSGRHRPDHRLRAEDLAQALS